MKKEFVLCKNLRISEIVEFHEELKVAVDGGNGIGIVSIDTGVDTLTREFRFEETKDL